MRGDMNKLLMKTEVNSPFKSWNVVEKKGFLLVELSYYDDLYRYIIAKNIVKM